MIDREHEFFVEAVDGTRLYTRTRPRESRTAIAISSSPRGDTGVLHPPNVTAVLCDGICCDGFIYKYLWDDLAEVCDVAHFHYRGHGRSELPHDPERISVAALAEDLHTVIRELRARRRHPVADSADAVRDGSQPPGDVILVGHSLGTQVALEAYRQDPSAFRALVLICGSFGRVTHTFKGSNLLATVLPDLIDWVTKHPKFARGLWARVPVNVALRVAGLIGDINIRSVRVDDVAPYFQHVVHVDFEMFLRMLKYAGEHSAEDVLPNVKVPTLVIAGDRDTITPPDLSRAMQGAIPNARLCEVSGGTHIAPLEKREEVARAIHEFLNASAVLRPPADSKGSTDPEPQT